MDLSDIEMLEVIVKCGSISKASEILHITQPTLSKRLSRLEYKLGTNLFDRNSSGLTPTDHTHFIIDSSVEIKNKVRNIERHIQLVNDLEVGELHIGVGPIIEQLYFPFVLLELTTKPGSKLNVTIRTEKEEDLTQLLVDGDIDIAVGPYEQSHSSDEYLIFPIASQPLAIATRTGHPITLEEKHSCLESREIFKNFALIAPHVPKYMYHQLVEATSDQSARIVCDNYGVIKDVLKESDHYTIGAKAIFAQEVEQNTLALTELPVPVRWYAACVVRRENAELPVIKRVMDVFRRLELP